MKSKNQIANTIYGVDFDSLSGGEKASITKKYTAQKAPKKATKARKVKATGISEVKFGRPGTNGVKTCLVNDGTTVSEAEEQAGLGIDYKKEGFIVKTSTHHSVGQTLKTSDIVYDGDLIMIVTGVDSAY